MGIVRWGELCRYTKTELTDGLRKKHARISRILPIFEELSIHVEGAEVEVTLESLWKRFYNDLSALAHNNRLDFLEERPWEVLYKRVNKGPYREAMTLQEISDELGVTRERIRQIEVKAFELFILRHVPLLFELKETVSGRYNLVSIEDILGGPFTMNDAEEAVLASIVKKCDIGLLYDTEYHAFFAGDNGQVDEDIAELIKHLMSEQRWYHPSRLKDKVNAYFEKNPTSLLTPDMVFETIVPNCFIMFRSLYFPAEGTKKDLLLPVFEAFFPEGLALIKNSHLFTDIAREMYPDYFGDNDDRSIYSSLLRNEEEVVIWDNGYYIPRSSISVDPGDLVPIKEWTIQLLKESQAPQIRLTRTLWHFREDLEQLGITNEYALYTCFKLYGSDEFDFVKAPRICLKGELDAARQPLTQIFYDYIKAQNRKVSRKEIVEHFKNQLGWETYHIEQRMGDQIIRAGYDEYIHIDNLQVNLQGLETVKTWLVRKMESVESVVSIKVVNRAIMKLANIDSYQTLYYMLEREYPDEFSFYIYPKLGLFDKEEEINAPSRRSPIALLEHYLQSGQTVAYRSELEKHFKSIGWASISYNSRNIIVYEFKNDQALAFVHKDTIGWTEEKRDAFLSLIHASFDELYEGNEFLLDMDVLYQNPSVRQRLPRLANGIEWTPALMVSLLKQEDETVTILGITEKTAIRDDNPHSIASELDLIHYLLMKEYQGAASIQQMERRLQELNVINRSMSRLYYNDQMDENIPYVTTPSLEMITQDLYRTRTGG
nr:MULTISPECIES: sigma factor-like helix-turn-helix DNA-binding protein [unclassified Paenibacillus]